MIMRLRQSHDQRNRARPTNSVIDFADPPPRPGGGPVPVYRCMGGEADFARGVDNMSERMVHSLGLPVLPARGQGGAALFGQGAVQAEPCHAAVRVDVQPYLAHHLGCEQELVTSVRLQADAR